MQKAIERGEFDADEPELISLDKVPKEDLEPLPAGVVKEAGLLEEPDYFKPKANHRGQSARPGDGEDVEPRAPSQRGALVGSEGRRGRRSTTPRKQARFQEGNTADAADGGAAVPAARPEPGESALYTFEGVREKTLGSRLGARRRTPP